MATLTVENVSENSEIGCFESLIAHGYSPAQAKAALDHCDDDLEAAHAWLQEGNFEEEAGDNTHSRIRNVSTWDPALTAQVTSVENYLRNDQLESTESLALFNSTVMEAVEEVMVEEMEEEMMFEEKSGILSKQSPSMLKGWQKRWFYLFNQYLEYYKDGNAIQRGTIDLREVNAIENGSSRTTFNINTTSSRTYELKATSEQDRDEWVAHITRHLEIIANAGLNQVLKEPPLTNFDIPVKELHRRAYSGDILLFSSKNLGGYGVQRLCSSEWDHIGLLIRYGKNQVSVLEALGSHGVQLFKWSDFINEKWYEQYRSMAIRRLYIPDKELRKEMLRNVANFVKQVVNCTYSWTPMKMLRRQSLVNDKELKDRNFFCSELIAKAYKLSGLLRDNVSSGVYAPSTFDQKHELHLLKGCMLLPEQRLLFED